jgi:hypothetical protein
LVVLIGDQCAIETAVANSTVDERYTGLRGGYKGNSAIGHEM